MAEQDHAPGTGPDAGRAGRGRPDHHDPTARVFRATPAHSALTLRLVLASFGLLLWAAIGIATLVLGGARWLLVVAVVLVVVSVVDLAVVARRKRRGEPG